MKNRKIIKGILFFFLFLIVILICSIIWGINNFDNLSIEKIIFHMNGDVISTTEKSFVLGYILKSFIPAIICFCSLVWYLNKKSNTDYIIKLRVHNLRKELYLEYGLFNKKVKIAIIIILLFVLIGLFQKLSLFKYIYYQFNDSTFIKEEYVNPKNVILTFPEKKKNLIMIYAESLESSFFTKDLEEGNDINLMPELYELSNNNLSFSNTKNNIGGAKVLSGTGWTTGGITAESAGLPLKINGDIINYSKLKELLPGGYSLGDILNAAGYNQELMIGSDKKFGNKDIYYKSHGNYYIYDYNTAKEKGKISKDYMEWWGYEDSKLFEYAREEITELSKQDKPFNFTLLTANTHHPYGYLEKDCGRSYTKEYANVVSCSSKQINEFVEWIKTQNFYDNTTIVILGDHLSMSTDFFEENEENSRRVLDIFINSSVTEANTKEREFSTMDFYPTIVASLGINIEGNRLGLGTNLFSTEETLLEKHGYGHVDKELSKKSKFYNSEILERK